MTKITTLITAILFTITAFGAKAQILTPVHWSYASKKISATEAVIFLKATIDKGWHLYSQTVQDGGPVRTTFTFQAAKDYSVVGKTLEPKAVTRFEKVFAMEVGFFEHEVVFQQKIKLRTGETTVKGTLEYMTCNNKQCLPPEDVVFNIPVR